jgi:tellurite resistance protein TerC
MDSISVLLFTDFLGKPSWIWLAFLSAVLVLLALDLGVLHRDNRAISARESLLLSAGYIGAGLLFGGWVWWTLGQQHGIDYFTGFLIEKSLSMDNVFVIAMIFGTLSIPRELQHRVLFWGILGVIVLRAAMIALGASLVAQFSWLLYVFGAFLLLTGIKMLFASDKPIKLATHPILKLLRKHFNITDQLHGDHFLVRLPRPNAPAWEASHAWFATPLLLALVLIELADLVFAVDSVPAIFAITQDPFIVYTSNIFAVLGLRALYFALAAMVHRFKYLKYALALVLIFIGSKIFLVDWVGKIPASISLGVTFSLIAGGVLVSMLKTRSGVARLERKH